MVPSKFENAAAERAMLAGLAQYGHDAFIDMDGLVDPRMISDAIWRDMYVSIGCYFSENPDRKIDYHSLIATGKRLNLAFISDQETKGRWRALVNYPIELDTCRREAAKIFRLSVARDLDEQMAGVRRNLHGVDGTESISEILGYAENPIFDFTSRINATNDGPVHIGKGGHEWLDEIARNPRQTVGIPSPFPRYNAVIGGGFRRKTVSFIAARRGTGKTIMCDNICIHVAKLGVPVLNIDTEMSTEEHRARIIAYLTGIDSNRIELGGLDRGQFDECHRAMDELLAMPYYYNCIQSESFDEQLATLRRWAVKTVGTGDGGTRRDCLVVYDWLQMEDPRESGYDGGHYKEYQVLDFHVGALRQMAKRCDLPIVAMGQLNRDGGIAGSDRITHKVSSYTTLLRKDEDDLMETPDYSLKLFIDKARHGPGSLPGDYINVKFDGATARMEEGPTRNELEKARRKDSGEFEVDRGSVGELDFADPDAVHRQPGARRAVQPRRRSDRRPAG